MQQRDPPAKPLIMRPPSGPGPCLFPLPPSLTHPLLPRPPGPMQPCLSFLQARRVLLSTDGPYDNVIKMKPPMVFGLPEAEHLAATLR